jgi:hypothetical protein
MKKIAIDIYSTKVCSERTEQSACGVFASHIISVA